MDIRQEKQYIYAMMQDITTERKNLAEVYYDLKKRLDRLDEIEMRGLDDISVDGYFNLHEKRQKQLSASNIRRELESLDKKLTQQGNPTQHQSTPVYQPPMEEVKKEMEKSIERIEKPKEPEQKIPKAVIEESKFKEKENKNVNKTKKKKKKSSLDFSKVGAVIRITLKEHGESMDITDIKKEVESMMEVEISDSNFRQNLMYRANKEYKDIVRVGRGRYEFVSDEMDRDRKEMKTYPKKEESQESLQLEEAKVETG